MSKVAKGTLPPQELLFLGNRQIMQFDLAHLCAELVNANSITFLDRIELVDAADPAVSQHQLTTLINDFPYND